MTGKQLQAFRKRLGLTQAALAQKLGVSVAIVAVWESRSKVPAKRVASILKLEK